MTSDNESIAELLSRLMPCNCFEAFKVRGLRDPACAYCNFADELEKVLTKREMDFKSEAETCKWQHRPCPDCGKMQTFIGQGLYVCYACECGLLRRELAKLKRENQ